MPGYAIDMSNCDCCGRPCCKGCCPGGHPATLTATLVTECGTYTAQLVKHDFLCCDPTGVIPVDCDNGEPTPLETACIVYSGVIEHIACAMPAGEFGQPSCGASLDWCLPIVFGLLGSGQCLGYKLVAQSVTCGSNNFGPNQNVFGQIDDCAAIDAAIDVSNNSPYALLPCAQADLTITE